MAPLSVAPAFGVQPEATKFIEAKWAAVSFDLLFADPIPEKQGLIEMLFCHLRLCVPVKATSAVRFDRLRLVTLFASISRPNCLV
jgi:hypothetical protein